MAGALAGCGCGEGLVAAAGGTLCMQGRSSRPSPSSSGLNGRNSCRFPLGTSLEHSLFSKRSVEVRVAADYSDSKPDSFKRRGKWGYHPLEDLSKVEKEEIEHAGDGHLTDAEVARTVSEVNWSAFIFSTVVSEKDAVFGTEVQYLVDDHGDLYFEIENDNEFLHSLSSTQVYTVLVGFGNVDGLQFSEVLESEAEEEHGESDSEEESSDESENADVEIYWEGVEDLVGLVGLEISPEESFSSLGGWGGFDSLDQVHPMDFASKVSECVSSDYISEIDKPARRLTITGVARPVTEEEEPYIQGIWYDRFLLSGGDEMDEDGNDDDSEEEEEEHNHDGNNAGLPAQNKSRNVSADGAIIARDNGEGAANLRKPEVLEGSQSGVVYGKPVSGTVRIFNAEDLDLRSKPSGSTGDSSASSSGSTAEGFDTGIDGLREGSDAHAAGIESRELGKRKQHRNKKRGSLIDGPDAKDEALELEEAAEIVLPPGATLEGDAVVGEWSHRKRSLDIGSRFYKLEMVSIQLDSGMGVQSSVEVRDFAYAEPDVLAHFSSTIIERVNSGGKKTENALKALCQRAKGLDVEEVSVVGVDCLGLDLRVRSGIEVQTVRIPFIRRATSEETADKLIDQLLFPRNSQRRPRKRGQEWNSR